MSYRVVLVEQTPTDVKLVKHVEQDRLMAVTFLECFEEMIRKDGNRILYSAILRIS